MSFNSQPPEGGWPDGLVGSDGLIVSTHSRPKAAGGMPPRKGCTFWRFNSQPPEGGWKSASCFPMCLKKFQLTAARRRLDALVKRVDDLDLFQLTAARRRLAARL